MGRGFTACVRLDVSVVGWMVDDHALDLQRCIEPEDAHTNRYLRMSSDDISVATQQDVGSAPSGSCIGLDMG